MIPSQGCREKNLGAKTASKREAEMAELIGVVVEEAFFRAGRNPRTRRMPPVSLTTLYLMVTPLEVGGSGDSWESSCCFQESLGGCGNER